MELSEEQSFEVPIPGNLNKIRIPEAQIYCNNISFPWEKYVAPLFLVHDSGFDGMLVWGNKFNRIGWHDLNNATIHAMGHLADIGVLKHLKVTPDEIFEYLQPSGILKPNPCVKHLGKEGDLYDFEPLTILQLDVTKLPLPLIVWFAEMRMAQTIHDEEKKKNSL